MNNYNRQMINDIIDFVEEIEIKKTYNIEMELVDDKLILYEKSKDLLKNLILISENQELINETDFLNQLYLLRKFINKNTEKTENIFSKIFNLSGIFKNMLCKE